MGLKIAFDVDDTLIVPAVATGLDIDVPNYPVIQIYKWFQDQGNHMTIWSGGGKDYAQMWADKLGLKPDRVEVKGPHIKKDEFDICFDDADMIIGKVNVKVKRLNNSVVRYPDKIWLTTSPTKRRPSLCVNGCAVSVVILLMTPFTWRAVNIVKSARLNQPRESLNGGIISGEVTLFLTPKIIENQSANWSQ